MGSSARCIGILCLALDSRPAPFDFVCGSAASCLRGERCVVPLLPSKNFAALGLWGFAFFQGETAPIIDRPTILRPTHAALIAVPLKFVAWSMALLNRF